MEKKSKQTHFTIEYLFPEEDKKKYRKAKRTEPVKNKISIGMKANWTKRRQEKNKDAEENNSERDRDRVCSVQCLCK